MKIIIIGHTAEGKTALAREIAETCRRHGIEVKVEDPDFDSQTGLEYASKTVTVAGRHSRLDALAKNGTKVEVKTVQVNREGNIPAKLHETFRRDGLVELIRDDIEKDFVMVEGERGKK